MRGRRKLISLWNLAVAVLAAMSAPSVGQRAAAATPAWRSSTYRTTLGNASLKATFQAGFLCNLKDLKTGQILLKISPTALPSKTVVFDTTPTNLDTYRITQEIGPAQFTTHYTAPDGSTWQTKWSIQPENGDLIMQASGRPVKPVQQFRLLVRGCDITKRQLVWVSNYGIGHVEHAGWKTSNIAEPETGSIPNNYVQPLVALFEGQNSGWLLEGRDPKLGPSNILLKGNANTATIGMVRRFAVATRTPELYEVRLRTYRKHWEDALDPYVDWLQKGAGLLPLGKKAPGWVNDIKTQSYIQIGDFAGLDALAKKVDPKKTLVGRQNGFTTYPVDMGYPDYRVNPEAKKWFKHARALGFHVSAHFNALSISVMFPQLLERYKAGVQVIGKDAKGKPVYDSAFPGGPSEMIRISAAYKPWRDYFVAQLKDAVDSGVDVIYLDECMTPGGKFVVNGDNAIHGMQLMIKQIMAAYPGVAVQTEQFNPLTAKNAAFALSWVPPGHPLSGYIFRRFVKVMPEAVVYSPADNPMMDAFASWGFFTPGASPGYRESDVEITRAFERYELVPDSRLPRREFTKYVANSGFGQAPVADYALPASGVKLFGYRGKGGVTAYYEKFPHQRGLVVYEPGKKPQWFGTRYSGLTSYSGQGLPVYFYFRHTVRDWLIYDDHKLMGLDPNETYWFDKKLKPSPTRFHVTKLPYEFEGITDYDKRIPSQEIGEGDSFFALTFAGLGQMGLYVPNGYDAYCGGEKVIVNPATRRATIQVDTDPARPVVKSPQIGISISSASTLLVVKPIDQELVGNWASLPWKASLDNLCWVKAEGAADFATTVGGIGRISGRLPKAKSLRLQGSYRMLDDGPGPPGDGVVRINGNEVLRVSHGKRPYPTNAFDVDISRFAGQHVLLEFISDGWPGRSSFAQWLAPRVVAKNE